MGTWGLPRDQSSLVACNATLPGSKSQPLLVQVSCLGFWPYNRNPARIFMGDTGALLLGYVLSTASVLGLFKMYTVVSFAMPVLILALPLVDTVFAVVRRLWHGENPMKADRGHIHHRLLALGLTQKQAVLVLYTISAIFALAAVLLAANGPTRFWLLLAAMAAAVAVWLWVFIRRHRRKQ